MPELRLLMVRHAESEANATGQLQGRLDSPLSEQGRRQAEALARRIAEYAPIDAIYSSPLMRARATAEAVGRRVGVEPRVLDELMEDDIGLASGLTWDEVCERFPEEATCLRSRDMSARWPGGESRQELADRAARAMDKIVAWHPEGTVVVVSHGGWMRWAVRRLMVGAEYEHPRGGFGNCSITEVVLRDGHPELVCLADSEYLSSVAATG